MDILELLREIADFGAIFYAAIGAGALGLFFWDRRADVAARPKRVEARERDAAAHAAPDSGTLHTPA